MHAFLAKTFLGFYDCITNCNEGEAISACSLPFLGFTKQEYKEIRKASQASQATASAKVTIFVGERSTRKGISMV
jgi:hypothetical protein